uniref:hypothetical protein n=1 Tax=Porphyridium aerugineum TaxID=2792 RepID=UPI001FCD5E55|nr:hypothetical protein MW505_pgp091 [Porphyridium aerugineum]UNJ17906.1 hypothetical protein [Porphyridium aerugineum]
MNDFLENSIRLFRFFISSMLGLIITISNPIISSFKGKESKWFIFILILLFTSTFFIIFIMTNPDLL